MNKKINILFILPSLCIGGAQRQLVDLVNGISEDRFNIYLLTFEKQIDLLESINKEKIIFYNFIRKHKYDFSITTKIAEVIDKNNIDIVHWTSQIALLYGFIGKLRARKKKVKFVGAIHTTVNRSAKMEFYDWFLYVPLMMFCNVIITVCQNQRIHWSRKYPLLRSKFRVIHNGIDTHRFKDNLAENEKLNMKKSLGIKSDEFVVSILSAFRKEKGHEYAFKAIKSLFDRGKKVKLLLIGDGDRRNYLESLSDQLSLIDNIIWLGFQKDPRPYLGLSDVLLLPSFAESFPMAILEAFAMGKPVIASDVGGISEIIDDGKNGYLVKPRDVDSIIARLETFMNDERLRQNFSDNARVSVEKRFGLGKMIHATEALLNKLVHNTNI